jgi:uncharacterized membrane protein
MMGTTEQNEPQSQTSQQQATTSRVEIKEKAKKAFKARYGTCLLIILILLVIGCIANPGLWRWGSSDLQALLPITGVWSVIMLLIVPPLNVGEAWCFLKIYRGMPTQASELFVGFKNYAHNLGGILWRSLFTFLWSCLFVIPGIVKAIAYSFTPYILQEYPNLAATDAIKVSMMMTKGHKGEIFVMYLSFIGWWFLSVITCGIVGIFYMAPYYATSLAGLYEGYKTRAFEMGKIDAQKLTGTL